MNSRAAAADDGPAGERSPKRSGMTRTMTHAAKPAPWHRILQLLGLDRGSPSVATSAGSDLEASISGARIVLSLATLLSIYLDPALGGFLTIDPMLLGALFVHLGFALAVSWAVRRGLVAAYLVALSTILDVSSAVVLALLTEGATSPAFAFFAFAIIAAGCRAGFRATLVVTLLSMLLYLFLISFLTPQTRNMYVMRPAYLAVTGYLIGFLGQQRAKFEAQLAERRHIARFFHDGYVQALAGIRLRLEGARELLRRGQPEDTQRELTELQSEVAREFDEVRAYIRSLAEVDSRQPAHAVSVAREPDARLHADFAAPAPIVESVLQIVLEATRNIRHHAQARSATVTAISSGRAIRITIDDDGIGFPRAAAPPWSIASRVAEIGGRCAVLDDGRPGGHLEIEMPTR
jgi:signal transduction histidine kinase